MAKDPAAVTKFLSDLKDKLQPLKTEEMDLFLQYKKEEVRCSHFTSHIWQTLSYLVAGCVKCVMVLFTSEQCQGKHSVSNFYRNNFRNLSSQNFYLN